MNMTLNPDIREVIDAVHYRPALSVILNIEAKINLKTEMSHALKIAADRAERELSQYYSLSNYEKIMVRLREIIDEIEIPHEKKGLAIYLSPIFEKVVFLDGEVEAKTVIDESFEIRDLLYNQEQQIHFILLAITQEDFNFYLGNNDLLTPLDAQSPSSATGYKKVLPQDKFLANFQQKQAIINDFMRQIAAELDELDAKYSLPILAIGPDAMLSKLKKLWQHNAPHVDYLVGNFTSLAHSKQMDIIDHYLQVRKAAQQEELLQRLEHAADQHRLAVGIQEVWRYAQQGKGQVLVVEKDYSFAAQRCAKVELIEPAIEPYNHFSYIRDAVDDIMEMVIHSGGEVVFTQTDFLQSFHRIALIHYYT